MTTAQLFAVFFGGGFGSVCRFSISQVFRHFELDSFPFATLISNVLSTALLGYLAVKITQLQSPTLYALLAIGFCGGFSTFSTFSLETIALIKSGQTAWAVLNICTSLASCLIILFAIAKFVK